MTSVELQVVGGGKMGEALVAGLLGGGRPPSSLRVVETDTARAGELAARYHDIDVADHPGPAAGTVLAVKPHHAPGVARAVGEAGGGRLLSIAAGVTLATLEEAVGPDVAVVRAMPNTPALVGAAVSAIAVGSQGGPDDLDWAEGILGAVGTVVRVPEHAMDAVTGLSGSGPAYVFLVLESLIDGGVTVGLPRDVATTLAAHTLLGAARLYVEGDQSPAELRAAVTSPGGTTAAGVRALEDRAVRAAFIAAVVAATERSVELGLS